LRIAVMSLFSVDAGSTRPASSHRGSVQSVTSQPPSAWMNTKNSSADGDGPATARKSGALTTEPAPIAASAFKYDLRLACIIVVLSVKVELGVANEAVTDGRPSGLRRREARARDARVERDRFRIELEVAIRA